MQYEVADIVAQNAKFAGFNLLLLSPSRLTDMDGTRNLSLDAAFLTNFGGGGAITARNLSNEERRCGGMSNGIDRQGASDWPKVKRGIQALDHVLNSMSEDINETKFVEDLFQLLTWVFTHAIFAWYRTYPDVEAFSTEAGPVILHPLTVLLCGTPSK